MTPHMSWWSCDCDALSIIYQKKIMKKRKGGGLFLFKYNRNNVWTHKTGPIFKIVFPFSLFSPHFLIFSKRLCIWMCHPNCQDRILPNMSIIFYLPVARKERWTSANVISSAKTEYRRIGRYEHIVPTRLNAVRSDTLPEKVPRVEKTRREYHGEWSSSTWTMKMIPVRIHLLKPFAAILDPSYVHLDYTVILFFFFWKSKLSRRTLRMLFCIEPQRNRAQ